MEELFISVYLIRDQTIDNKKTVLIEVNSSSSEWIPTFLDPFFALFQRGKKLTDFTETSSSVKITKTSTHVTCSIAQHMGWAQSVVPYLNFLAAAKYSPKLMNLFHSRGIRISEKANEITWTILIFKSSF